MAVWNMFLPERSGTTRTRHDPFDRGKRQFIRALVYRLDSTHGSPLAAIQRDG